MLYSIENKNIYHSKLDINIAKKASNIILDHQNKFNQNTWNCQVRTSKAIYDNILNLKELHELKINTISHIENYMHLNNNFIDGYIHESWINIYEKNFYQEFHTHENFVNKYYSGVIYLTNDNSEIEFDVSFRKTIKPEFSDILIFPDNYPHRVSPNLNENLRISLAFNYLLCNKTNDSLNLK